MCLARYSAGVCPPRAWCGLNEVKSVARRVGTPGICGPTVCGLCGSPRRARPPKGVRIVRTPRRARPPEGVRIVRTPRRVRPPEGVRIVRIATPGSTPEGCADCADRHAGLDPRRVCGLCGRRAGFDPRRVCGLCGSPRRARPPEGVRIVRIATPGSTPGECADCADRRAGFDPRRVCGLCGSPRRARPPESVRIVRTPRRARPPESVRIVRTPRRARPPKGVRIVRIATPGSTPGECADRADPPTGGQVTVRDDFPHRGIFRLTRPSIVPILFPNRNGTTMPCAPIRRLRYRTPARARQSRREGRPAGSGPGQETVVDRPRPRQAASLRRAASTSTRLSWNTAPPPMSESRSATVRLRLASSPTILGQ